MIIKCLLSSLLLIIQRWKYLNIHFSLHVPPINQKRTISFINHFIIHTVTFLNKFALSCEEKLFEFENKLQRVEASLAILESRLSSIPDLQPSTDIQNDNIKENNEVKSENVEVSKIDEPDNVEENKSSSNESCIQQVERDPRYDKYFRMIHFGAQKEAVKLQVQQEGLDPTVLDEPQHISSKSKSNVANTTASQSD
ncbi:WASH complex subunit 3-like isoform X1 [Vespa mandarinia]|uniref:WASH complex subunit 3-like isoform X1 n=1 Tax=Vespa mandarinia TaxID=7446 RepID=UPI001617FC8A|nr:WASH complex subunit 3-like isoform X1 [Vespa mandarinia]